MGQEIYSRLYDVTKKNFEAAKEEIPYTKEVFLFATEQEYGKCNLLNFIDLENDKFLEAAYYGLFGRLPDSMAYSRWALEMDLEKEKFQEKLLHALLASEEYKEKGEILENNIYSRKNTSHSYYSMDYFIDNPLEPVMNKLIRVYQKAPRFVRKFAKFVLKR